MSRRRPSTGAATSTRPTPRPGALESALRQGRASGRKLLVPYVTGGLGPRLGRGGARPWPTPAPTPSRSASRSATRSWTGPVIQAASERALAAGATPVEHPRRAAPASTPGCPLAVMTYYNIAFRMGLRALRLVAGRPAAWRPPSCPTCRSRRSGRGPGRPTPPGSRPCCWPRPPPPTSAWCGCAPGPRGFVYAVGLLGVTGERDAPGRQLAGDRPAAQGGDRQAGAGRRGRVQRRPRRSRCARRPTAW